MKYFLSLQISLSSLLHNTSGFSLKCGTLFPNHFCGSIHHSTECLFLLFSFTNIQSHVPHHPQLPLLTLWQSVIRNVRLSWLYLGVILFSSSYVYVDVLSAFHVSTSIYEWLLLFSLYPSVSQSLSLSLSLSTHVNANGFCLLLLLCHHLFTIILRFHLRKLIQ